MQIQNNTVYTLGFASPPHRLHVGPGETADCSFWPDLERQAGVQAQIDAGDITVRVGPSDQDPERPDLEPMHWRKAVQVIESATDLDWLREVRDYDRRRGVVSAARDRLDALEAEDD